MNLYSGPGGVCPRFFLRSVVQNLQYFIMLDYNPCPPWTDWVSVHNPHAHTVLMVHIIISTLISFNSLGLWCFPCHTSIFDVPLGFSIICSCLYGYSVRSSIVAHLFDAYLKLPGHKVLFVLFGWRSIGASQGIISAFLGSSLPSFLWTTTGFWLILLFYFLHSCCWLFPGCRCVVSVMLRYFSLKKIVTYLVLIPFLFPQRRV